MMRTRLEVVQGDITRERVDAIVNAANTALKRGGGVDGAIHRAAGPGLQVELDRIGGCPTGDCRLSSAHDVPVQALIHCVGPVWHGGNAGEAELLSACYRNAIALARRHGLDSLAFPAISTGVYGYPAEDAATVAVATVRAATTPPNGINEVRFVCFDSETTAIYQKLLELDVDS